MKKEIINKMDVQWLVDRFYDKIKTDYILGYIGDSTAEAADHIKIPNGILTFFPAIPLFK